MTNRLFSLISFLWVGSAAAADDAAADSIGPVINTGTIISWMVSTFAILFIIFLMAYLLKKTKFVKVNKGTLGIENQLFLSPKQKVVLIRAGTRKILLGVTQTQITYLADLEDPKLEFEKVMAQGLPNDVAQNIPKDIPSDMQKSSGDHGQATTK